jgi:20S proteasome subunit alpha 2
VEKKLSTTLIDEESLHKINLISGHIGAVYAGLGPDFKALIQMSRKNNISYQLEYGE